MRPSPPSYAVTPPELGYVHYSFRKYSSGALYEGIGSLEDAYIYWFDWISTCESDGTLLLTVLSCAFHNPHARDPFA